MVHSSRLYSTQSWVSSTVVGLLTLAAASTAHAAAEGEACGRLGSWSAQCDDGLECEVRWSFWKWYAGICTGEETACGGRPCSECQSDADCLHGYCDIGVTCAGIGCPPPPPNRCTVCGDGSQLLCRRAMPICPEGLVPEIVDSCYGACVDRYTCEPEITCEYEGTVYRPGESFEAADGCNDCTCAEDGMVVCTLRLCTCDYDDPTRTWVSRDPEECTRLDFMCAPATQQFSDPACGCGCETIEAE